MEKKIHRETEREIFKPGRSERRVATKKKEGGAEIGVWSVWRV